MLLSIELTQTLVLLAILIVLAWRPKNRKVQILRHGQHHHWCEMDSRDYKIAYKTKGLTLKHPDGTVVEGIQ